MSSHVQTMQGERMRFMVRSRTNPRTNYLVDLLANGGMGECTCRHWLTTIWPRIRDGKTTIEDSESRCWHVAEARMAFLNDLLQHMAAQEVER